MKTNITKRWIIILIVFIIISLFIAIIEYIVITKDLNYTELEQENSNLKTQVQEQQNKIEEQEFLIQCLEEQQNDLITELEGGFNRE
jgi:predicted PurR-regulated permease PerM